MQKTLKITKAAFWAIAAALALIDSTAFLWIDRYLAVRSMDLSLKVAMLVSIYAGSFFIWCCLFNLLRLLRNIEAERVFVWDNTRLMSRIALCCFMGGLIGVAALFCYVPFIFLGAAGLFVGMIVLVVKSCFEKAIAMKEELDLTI